LDLWRTAPTANLKTIWPRGAISAKLQHKCKQLGTSLFAAAVQLQRLQPPQTGRSPELGEIPQMTDELI